MNNVEHNLDEFGKRVLKPLRQAPPIDPSIAADERSKFLHQGEIFRQAALRPSGDPRHSSERAKPDVKPTFRLAWSFKPLVIVLLAIFLLAGSSITVFAAQGSLPGESLYTIKSLSEDVRLALTISQQSRLDLTMEYTNRRVDEIAQLLKEGKSLPVQSSRRFQNELENALDLAARMDDHQLQSALVEIKKQAASQGMTITEIINNLPTQAEPAVINLTRLLEEQIQLSNVGEQDPKAFREEIRIRRLNRDSLDSEAQYKNNSTSYPIDGTASPSYKNNNGNGNGKGQPTQLPSHDNNNGNNNHP